MFYIIISIIERHFDTFIFFWSYRYFSSNRKNVKLELVEINGVGVCDWQYRIIKKRESMSIICISYVLKTRCGVMQSILAWLSNTRIWETFRYLHTSSFDHTVISQVIERNVKIELVEINGIGVCDWKYRKVENRESMNIICK